MDKIIFLDIDGVLNCQNTFKETKNMRNLCGLLQKNSSNREEYINLILQEDFLELDYSKIMLLKEITDLTGAKIVVSSSWIKLDRYPLIEEKLICFGLPIVGEISELGGIGIDNYIKENYIKEYLIIDDSIHKTFTEEHKYNLIWTNYYQDGLNGESVYDAINVLGLKK